MFDEDNALLCQHYGTSRYFFMSEDLSVVKVWAVIILSLLFLSPLSLSLSIFLSLSLSISLSVYIYIYIYIMLVQ